MSYDASGSRADDEPSAAIRTASATSLYVLHTAYGLMEGPPSMIGVGPVDRACVTPAGSSSAYTGLDVQLAASE